MAGSLTAGQIVTRISEQRSKIALLELCVMHLRTNYLSTEGRAEDLVPPEMYVTRSDGSRVSEDHIEVMLREFEVILAETREELLEWESITMAEVPKKKKKRDEDHVD